MVSSLVLGICLAFTLPRALGSAGDMSPNFAHCTRKCRKTCDPNNIPLYRQYLLWDCNAECDYDCMHEVSQLFKEEYDVIVKFYGHWPYTRIWGLQEPAAAVFSVGNMIPHVHNLIYNRGVYIQPRFPIGRHIVAYSLVGLLAWTASALFHARKIDPFIGCDYAFAFMFISYGLWIAITRLWWEFRCDKNKLIKLAFDMFYTIRIVYQIVNILLGNVHFQDHMKLSIALSIVHSTIWFLYCCFSKSPTKIFCLFCQVWFGAASMLELFDFPPYVGIFDAHALWHAATIPLGFFWFYFWVMDSNYWTSLSNADASGEVSIAKKEK